MATLRSGSPTTASTNSHVRDEATGQFYTGPYIVVCNDRVTIKEEVNGDGERGEVEMGEAFVTAVLVLAELELRDWIKEQWRKRDR